MIKLDCVTIEGPDLAGKTTLYNSIHKRTGFKWNIQDRAELSMLCYSILYERGDEDVWRRRLTETISNLNNRIIVLLPSWDILEQRFKTRGDDVQTLESLRKLYAIFVRETEKIKNNSTVLLLTPVSEAEFQYDVINSIAWLSSRETDDSAWPARVAEEIKLNALSAPNKECTPLRFRLEYKPADQEFDASIMQHPPEEIYYANILKGVLSNIKDELDGKNDYGTPQTPFSTRRFIFTQDSCISLIHTMFRDNTMNVHVVCRSSDTVNTFEYDLKFLYYLTSRILAKSGVEPNDVQCRLYVTLNSAHVI